MANELTSLPSVPMSAAMSTLPLGSLVITGMSGLCEESEERDTRADYLQYAAPTEAPLEGPICLSLDCLREIGPADTV